MTNQFKTKKEVVDIKLVLPNVWNPNKQSDFIFKKEIESIKQFGFVGSIIVRDKGTGVYEIIDGEHRYRAAKELGYTEIPVENAGQISEQEAKTLLFLLNMRGKDDVDKQVAIFDSLEQGQISLLPFTEQEIERAKEFVKFDFNRYQTKDGEDKKEIEPESRTIAFGVTNSEYELVGKVFQRMRTEGLRSDKECLMKLIEGWCELNIMRNYEGEWDFNLVSRLK